MNLKTPIFKKYFRYINSDIPYLVKFWHKNQKKFPDVKNVFTTGGGVK